MSSCAANILITALQSQLHADAVYSIPLDTRHASARARNNNNNDSMQEHSRQCPRPVASATVVTSTDPESVGNASLGNHQCSTNHRSEL